MNRSICGLVTAAWLAFPVRTAGAQSPPTCESAHALELTVVVHGIATTIDATPDGIFVNGLYCGETDDIDTLNVIGGSLGDSVTLKGTFAPGYTYEPDSDELEVVMDLDGGSDTLTISRPNGSDSTYGWGTGVLLNTDADVDVVLFNVDNVKVRGNGGDDTLDFWNYSGPAKIWLYGGSGDDRLQGTLAADNLYGDAGFDRIRGLAGNDVIYDGPGPDEALGDDGNDRLVQDASSFMDSWDQFDGGAGTDTVSYQARTVGVTVLINNGIADDGQANEFDLLENVERVTGGSGDDVLVGTATANILTGGAGADSLYGLGGPDTLFGGDGADHLVGDVGADTLWGDGGDDTLEGDAGADGLHGGGGNDILDGGSGLDSYAGEDGDDFFYNDDGIAETVDCGPGTDDPEPDLGATDTFIACELI